MAELESDTDAAGDDAIGAHDQDGKALRQPEGGPPVPVHFEARVVDGGNAFQAARDMHVWLRPEIVVEGFVAIKLLGPFIEEFAKKLGEQLGESAAGALKRIRLRGGRNDGGPTELIVGAGAARTIFILPAGDPDSAKRAIMDFDFTAPETHGQVMLWSEHSGTWQPCKPVGFHSTNNRRRFGRRRPQPPRFAAHAIGSVTELGFGTRNSQCPYPGLAPFGAENKQLFYGRDQVVALVCERLDARLHEGGPLVLIGPTGAGKSSLLAAGLLPALERGALPLPGSSRWTQLMLTPTAKPALALAVAAGLGAEDAQRAADSWRFDASRCAADLLEMTSVATAAGSGESCSTGLVVVIDQFEEAFTLCTDEAERQWLISLVDLLAQPTTGASVVLSVRANFYSECMAHPQLRAALQAGTVMLEPMTEVELRQAIRLPAHEVGLEVEDGLVEVLLADLRAGAGPGAISADQLPLLAHALRATWQLRSGRVLTLDGYQATGGIQRAIATTADRLFNAVPSECHETVRWVFLRMVTRGHDGGDTRHRVLYNDLLREAPDPLLAAEVVHSFANARLLTWDGDTVSIAHEVVVGAWPRLREWIGQDQAGNLVRQDLEEAAAAWELAGRKPDALYRGDRLEVALAWARTHGPELSTSAAAFLATARRQHRHRPWRS